MTPTEEKEQQMEQVIRETREKYLTPEERELLKQLHVKTDLAVARRNCCEQMFRNDY